MTLTFSTFSKPLAWQSSLKDRPLIVEAPKLDLMQYISPMARSSAPPCTDFVEIVASIFRFGLRGGSRRHFTPPVASVSRKSA
jgi:hypothetical protein